MEGAGPDAVLDCFVDVVGLFGADDEEDGLGELLQGVVQVEVPQRGEAVAEGLLVFVGGDGGELGLEVGVVGGALELGLWLAHRRCPG